jgi:hypothetical protein
MKIVLVGVLVIFTSFLPREQECDQLKFDINIVHTTDGQDNGKIEVSNINSPSQVKAFLYGNGKNKNKLDVKIENLEKLGVGTYTLILQNKKCSTVTRDIIIR